MSKTTVISTGSANFFIYEQGKEIGFIKPENGGYISKWTGSRFNGLKIWWSTQVRAIDSMIIKGNEVEFKNEVDYKQQKTHENNKTNNRIR